MPPEHDSDDWPIPKHATHKERDEDAITPVSYPAKSSQAAAERRSSQTTQGKASSSLRSSNDGISQPEKGKKKKNSFKSFLTLKEPSQIALEEFARQQRKLAAERGMDLETAGIPGVSSAQLPPTVPKVNSKWDGMPESAKKEKNGDSAKRTSVSSRSGRSRHSDRSSGRSSGSTSTSKFSTVRIAASPARSPLAPASTSRSHRQTDPKMSKAGPSIEIQPLRKASQIAPWSEPQLDRTLHIAPFLDPTQGRRETTMSTVPGDANLGDRMQDQATVLPEISFFFPSADELPPTSIATSTPSIATSTPSIAEFENDAIPPDIQRARTPKPTKSPFLFGSPKSSPLSKLVIRPSTSKSPSHLTQKRLPALGNTDRSDSQLTSSTVQAVRQSSMGSPTKAIKRNERPKTMQKIDSAPIPKISRPPFHGFLAGEAQSIHMSSDEDEEENQEEQSEEDGDVTPRQPSPEPSTRATSHGRDSSRIVPSLSKFDFAFGRKSTETGSRPTTQDSQYAPSAMSNRLYPQPETADDGASVLSEQWFKTPQERLGLGGIIRRKHPSEELEVPTFLSGGNAGMTATDKKKKKRWSILKGSTTR